MPQPAPHIGTDRTLDHHDRDWVCEAVARIGADFNRSSDTHLIKLELPCLGDIDLYLKDESSHPSGSLKHRLARSLILYGLYNGWIRKDTPIIESSSGSTAISEAYFARLLGLPFIAVLPDTTAKERIADSMFSQMSKERFAIPKWVVVSAGTGGTSSTIGRYIRYRPELFAATKLCVVDPENSVFFDYFRTGDGSLGAERGSRIERIGRPRVEPSFLPAVIDRMIRIPDAASIAAIWWLESVLGKKCGGSTGTNLSGALQIAAEMIRDGEGGSIVTMICDPGERYLDTYYDRGWLEDQGLEVQSHVERFKSFVRSGHFDTE